MGPIAAPAVFLGALVVTDEHGTGPIRATFPAPPRGRLLAGTAFPLGAPVAATAAC